MSYTPLPKYLTIKKSKVHGLGLFTLVDIPKGYELGMSHISINTMIIRTPLGGFYNHSDDPNCEKYIKFKNKGYSNVYYYLKTIKDIKKGEELTVKYTLYNIE